MHCSFFVVALEAKLPWPGLISPPLTFPAEKHFSGYLTIVGFLVGKINRVIKYGKPLELCLPLG